MIMMLLASTQFARADDQSEASQQPEGLPDTNPVPPVPVNPTEATPVAPRQVDSNPQDGEVYRVPVGVEDKTPNLTESFVHGNIPPPTAQE